MKTDAMPKTIQKWIDAHPELIDEYHIENDEFGSSEGHPYSIWLYLDYGWINTSTDTHCIHEYLVKDFFAHVACIEKCECQECLITLAKREQS